MNPAWLLSRRWIPFTVLVLAATALCARLGIWQLDRLKQRKASNAQVSATQAMAPLKLPAQVGEEDLPALQYRRVSATGVFDATHQVALLNQYYNGQYGYHLLTPLVMQGGEAVLVDRGWIPPESSGSPSDWRKYDVPGTVSIDGIVQLGASATAVFGAAADPTLAPGQTALDRWIYVDLPRLAQQMPYPIMPVYIEPDPNANATDPPIPSQDQPDLSDGPHLSYAIQWFSFAAIMLAGYPFYVRRQERMKT